MPALTRRLMKLEQRTLRGSPYYDLTDDELDAAIAALNESIVTATGMSPAELAHDLAQRQQNGTLPDELSPQVVRQFMRSFKSEFAARA